MELEEAVEILKNFIKYFEAEATARKFRRSITIVVDEDDIEAIETVLKYIKEESIPRAVIEEKIEEVRQLENVSIADLIESEKEFCMDILEELLTKGE